MTVERRDTAPSAWRTWLTEHGLMRNRDGVVGATAPAQVTGIYRTQDDTTTPQYRVAYEQALRALDDQRDELNGIRQRVGAYTALVFSATAFLVGSGLKDTSRDITFWVLAIIATVLTVATLGMLATVLRPAKWDFRLSGKRIVESWIEHPANDRVPNEQQLLRALTLSLDQMKENNTGRLTCIQALYFGVIVVGGMQLAVWGALVWVHAPTA